MLQFGLHPVTLQTWVDCFTKLWDHYANDLNLHQYAEDGNLSLRSLHQSSYSRLRFIHEMVDAIICSALVQDDQRQLVASVMYLVLAG